MLRIVRNDVNPDRVVLTLHGHIVGEWADLLEQECATAKWSGLSVAIDLADVSFIGRSGLDALGRLTRSGVELNGCPPLIADMLRHEGIEAGRRADDETSPADPKGSS